MLDPGLRLGPEYGSERKRNWVAVQELDFKLSKFGYIVNDMVSVSGLWHFSLSSLTATQEMGQASSTGLLLRRVLCVFSALMMSQSLTLTAHQALRKSKISATSYGQCTTGTVTSFSTAA